MEAFSTFEAKIQYLVNHLYDPGYQTDAEVRALLCGDTQAQPPAVRAAIFDAIASFKPGPEVPPGTRGQRVYDILSARYVQNLTQAVTSERLSLSPRHLRREQGQAVHELALRIWQRAPGTAAPTPEADHAPAVTSAAPDHAAQVRDEVKTLQQGTLGGVCHVSETMSKVTRLVAPVAGGHGVTLCLQPSPGAAPMAAISAPALRQVLVRSITEQVRRMSGGQVTLACEQGDNQVEITITSFPASDIPPEDALIQELLNAHSGALQSSLEGNTLTQRILLPTAGELVVLVVDDNPDLVHVYRRYVQGTQYRIEAAPDGRRIFETVAAVAPDMIILDIMLPEIDGWELLTRLHEHPATQAIPVIICSVVDETELALALGAACTIPKPVQYEQVIAALGRASALLLRQV